MYEARSMMHVSMIPVSILLQEFSFPYVRPHVSSIDDHKYMHHAYVYTCIVDTCIMFMGTCIMNT